MRTFKEQLAHEGVGSLAEWFEKNPGKPFPLLLRTIYDNSAPHDFARQTHYWAYFIPWNDDHMAEIRFLRSEGRGEPVVLTYIKEGHVLHNSPMIANKPVDSIETEFAQAEAKYASAFEQYLASKDAWEKGGKYGKKPQNPSRPHKIFEYLMRGDIAILEKNRH